MRFTPVLAALAMVLTMAAPRTVLAEHAGPLNAECTNPEWGYAINYPENWSHNERTEGPGGTVEACRYFAPQAVDVQPGTEPTDVSIGMDRDSGIAYDAAGGEPTTVGGRNAFVLESEDQMTGGLQYQYRIEMPEWGPDDALVARTFEVWIGDYEENKQILDGMMESLVFTTQDEPGDATPTPDPVVPDAATSAPTTVSLVALLAGIAVLLVFSGLTMVVVRRS